MFGLRHCQPGVARQRPPGPLHGPGAAAGGQRPAGGSRGRAGPGACPHHPVRADLRAYREGEGSFDLCACNPPYFTAGFQSSNAARATARHETDCTLEDVCACGFRLLKDGGRLALCHRPERLAEVLAVLRAHRLEPKRLAFVKNKAESAPWLFLVEAQKNRKTGLKIEPDILIAAGAAMYGTH